MARKTLDNKLRSRKFTWKDYFYNAEKGNPSNITCDVGRDGYKGGKYRDIQTSIETVDGRYIYVEAVITYDSSTPAVDIVKMIADAKNFIKEVKKKSYAKS